MQKGGIALKNLTINDWMVLVGSVLLFICVASQIYVNTKTREEMRVYRGKFFELTHMYEAVNSQLKDVTDLNGRILALNDEVIKNDESILNDVKRLTAETEKLHDYIRAGVNDKAVGSDPKPGE